MKSAPFVLLALATSVFAETKPITRGEIIPTLRGILLDMHGGASALPRYAERLERERGFTRVQMEDLLLEIATDESWDGFARNNAVVEFIEIARPEELSRLEPFYVSTNRSIRASIQSFLLEQLETVPEKLAYARTRWDWMAEHTEFQCDAMWISIGLRTILHYSQPAETDRRLIMDFFWNAATNAAFAESAHEAEMLLLSDDPSWPTNEARRAMMEKWKDDPSLPEKTRSLWNDVLADFGRTNAVGHAGETTGSSDGSPAEAATVGEPLQARTESVLVPAEAKPAAADETPAEAPQEPVRSFSAWIAGAAALALAAALACFVVSKCRRR